jgi:hypothetical protein
MLSILLRMGSSQGCCGRDWGWLGVEIRGERGILVTESSGLMIWVEVGDL